MEITKIIKEWGNSAVVVLTKDDLKILNKEIGDVVMCSDGGNSKK